MNSNPSDLPPLLAIETSTATCAVGACVNGETFEDTRYLERLHNQQVLGMIDDLSRSIRDRFGSKFAGFGLVGFGRGPGSFTGVRIGAALAQGIAFAQDAQVLPLASLQVQAQALLDPGEHVPLDGAPQVCVVFVKSRQQLYYAQAFARSSVAQQPLGLAPSEWRGLSAPVLLQDSQQWTAWQAELALDSNGLVLLGQQPEWLNPTAADGSFVPQVTISARSVLRVGLSSFLEGHAVAPEFGLPEYLSADSPWQPGS